MNSLHLIKQGDAAAFRDLFCQFRLKIYAYFLMKSKDPAVSEELTQITFIKLWDNRERLSELYSIETQIFRIARTVFIDYLRARATQRKLQSDISRFSEVHDQQPSHDYQHHIELALQALPPMRKKVFILNRMDGLSYKEIASMLSISDRTVEKHISMAIKQLRKILMLLLLLLFVK